jgi:5-methylcytosine-specific restriction protein A
MPLRADRLCGRNGCRGIVCGSVCSICGPKRQSERKPDHRASAYRRGYGGQNWEALRKAVFIRDNYICQECGDLCIEGGERSRWPVADHIIPKKDGGEDVLGNLQTLCFLCHNAKTRRGE